MNKKAKLLFILSVIFISIGITGFIVGFIIQRFLSPKIGKVISAFGSIFEILALVLIIVRSVKFGFAPANEQEMFVKEVKIVDVKPIPETQEQKLYKQYEELYKEGLVSKEDLEKKRIELLGK